MRWWSLLRTISGTPRSMMLKKGANIIRGWSIIGSSWMQGRWSRRGWRSLENFWKWQNGISGRISMSRDPLSVSPRGEDGKSKREDYWWLKADVWCVKISTSILLNGTVWGFMIVPSGMASIYRRMLTFDGGSFGERTKRGLFISSDSRRKRTKEDCYPQGPLQRGMQPLLLSLLHSCVPLVASDQRSSECILDPSKGRDVFYRLR